ncbi:hypothetical protein WJX74_005507 [Apatococcus lobatus]|uniref:Acetyl-CoA synthetase-like protein n=1 Tax=Apatococcus lobatus TaxID=904363 RepID=A0AAW1Q9B4_9CHLO
MVLASRPRGTPPLMAHQQTLYELMSTSSADAPDLQRGGLSSADSQVIIPSAQIVKLAATLANYLSSTSLSEAGTKLLILLSKDNEAFAVSAAEKRGIPTLVVQVNTELQLTCCHQEGPKVTLSERTRLHDPPQPNDVALLLYTSGTTSRPKGVPLRHENLAAGIDNVINTYALGPKDVSLLAMPLFHIHGIVAGLLAPLAAGSHVILPVEGQFHAETFWRDACQHKITWFTAVPTLHQLLLARSNTDIPQYSRPPLRFIRSCSSALAPARLSKLESTYNVPVLEAYAMTEASHQMCSNPLPANGKRKPGSVGTAQGSIAVTILDEQNKPLSRPNAAGEVAIRGPSIMSGYVNCKEEASEEAFQDVAEAVAFASPDELLGEVVEAVVVLHQRSYEPGHDQAASIRSFLASRLTHEKVPRVIHVEDAIPKSATGKVQRRNIAQQYAHADPAAKKDSAIEGSAAEGSHSRRSLTDEFAFVHSNTSRMVEALLQGDPSLPPILPGSITSDQKRELLGQLDVASLRQAVADLCERHEALSTRFKADPKSSSIQKVTQPGLRIELEQAAAEDEKHAASMTSAATCRRYDMSKGPLARVFLIRLSEHRHWLVVAIHHAISDATSRSIIWHDLGRLYTARAQQQPSRLPKLSLQEADYSAHTGASS